MKIDSVQTLHANAGWRVYSFLRIATDTGVVGYSEFNEGYGSPGLTQTIERLGERIRGQDAGQINRISALLYAFTRQAPGGMTQQAIAAIENALLDIKGKALGVPVYELLGGKVRDRLRLYWSHCGTTRVSAPQHIEADAVTSLDDLVRLGREVVEKGFSALKTNILLFDNGKARVHMPGFSRALEPPEINWDRRVLKGLREEMEAWREGVGPDFDILLDLNFNFRTEGYLQVVRELDPYRLMWFEIDSYDAPALRQVRDACNTPINSGESLFGTRGYRPFFENHSMDVVCIDVPWNGALTSQKVAAMADAYEMNAAPHNFYGHLCTMMSAHFCAATPNFRIMEIDIDDVPWKDELYTHTPEIRDGELVVPDRPGWGTDVNEAAVAAHPVERMPAQSTP